MNGLDGVRWRCGESLPLRRRATDPAIAVLLASFSTGLPPELVERLRGAARKLGLHESLIATVAIALFLDREWY